MSRNYPVNGAPQSAIGALLGSLIVARQGKLEHLDVSGCYLDDHAFAALSHALSMAPHLRELEAESEFLSDECIREHLLPALRANTRLAELRLHLAHEQPSAAVLEAEQLVRDRSLVAARE